MEFTNQRALTGFLASRMREGGLPEEISLEVAKDILPLFHQPQLQVKGFGRIFGKRWAIREDDLKLLDLICSGLTVGALAATGGPVLAVTAGSVTAIAKFVYALVKKGVRVTPLQNMILVGLKVEPHGKRLEDLVNWLRYSYGAIDWSNSKVEAELAQLGSIALNDGTIVALVSKDSGNRWYAAGI